MNKGWFSQWNPDVHRQVSSEAGLASWEKRSKDPNEVERLRTIGALGGHRGGGRREGPRSKRLIH